MRELHGIADAERVQAANAPNYKVSVVDGVGLVILSIADATYPAGLTPDRARFIAKQLVASASRVEKIAALQGNQIK